MANTDSGVMGKARHSHPVTQWPHVRSLRKAPMILYHVQYRLASAYLAQRGHNKRDMQIVSWKEREWNVTKWSRSRAWRLFIGNSNCTKRKWKQWQWWRSHQHYACLKAACQIFAIGEKKTMIHVMVLFQRSASWLFSQAFNERFTFWFVSLCVTFSYLLSFWYAVHVPWQFFVK